MNIVTVARKKFRSFNMPEIDDGILTVEFPKQRADQSRRRDEAAPHDEVRAEPILALPLVEHHLQKAEAHAQQPQTDVINPQAAQAFANQVGRVEDQERGHQDGEGAHGNVDEEDPSPGVVVGNPAAQRGADDGRHDHAHAVDRHRHALFFLGEAFHQNRLRNGLQRATSRALEDAEEDQQAEAGSHAAQEGAGGEDDHTGHIETLAAENRREPTGERQHDRVRNQVGGEHPGALVDAGGEIAGDVRQRDVGDTGVEHFHEGGEHHRHGDDPGIGLTVLSRARKYVLHKVS